MFRKLKFLFFYRFISCSIHILFLCSQILSLKISTYPQIRSFRLQDILSKCDSLQTIVVDVREPTLSHQIQWAFGGKLRELVITGHNLAVIVPDAFQGKCLSIMCVCVGNMSNNFFSDYLLIQD